MVPNRPWLSCVLRLRWRKKRRLYLLSMSMVGPQSLHSTVRTPRPLWDALESAHSVNEGCKTLPDVKFLSQLLGPFKLWTRRPLFWKIYHLLPTHTHIQKHDCWANKSFQRKQIPFQCSQLHWAGKGEMLFFQYEGKTRSLLVYPV